MTRLRALNESSSDDSEEENEERETIEAQEERAFSLYKKALELRQKENYPEAEELLISLLNDDFLVNVCSEDQSSGADGLVRPAVALKYACLKNLGNVFILQNRPEDGLKCFIQAVELDESDVTMWHQMGNLALQIDDFHLASQAFQEGLRCNAHHWPCLDSLLPVLYALNDYLGCLLLVSRALDLDPEYPQALALRDQIFKEDQSLLDNFKKFFPDEIDIVGLQSNLDEHSASKAVAHALSLQERYKIKSAFHSDITIDLECNKLTTKLSKNTWEELGRSLIQTYNNISGSGEKSFLDPVEITFSESSNSGDPDDIMNCQSAASDNNLAQVAVNADIEAGDVDSEQDAKGEDQTEEDATEASGLEEEVKSSRNPPLSSPGLKRKRKRTSTNLMDQWSKRRSGRRAGRKAEDREESNLASRFRSFLPETLLSKDLEAEIAKASKRRSLRDPMDDWGDGSMDTAELCRLLQERDAQDEHKRKLKQNSKEPLSDRINRESYFGTNKESSDVCLFVEQNCSGTHNIIELITNFTKLMTSKSSLSWPSGLVALFIEAYECMRKHVPFYSPFNGPESSDIELTDLYASLLYCELLVDIWQQKSLNNQDNMSDDRFVLAEALGNVMLLACLDHIFSSTSEQSKVMVRIHWVRVKLFLLQENSSSAIHSLQDVLESLEMMEAEEKLHGKMPIDKCENPANYSTQSEGVSLEPCKSLEENTQKPNEVKSDSSTKKKSYSEDSSDCRLLKDMVDIKVQIDVLSPNASSEMESSSLNRERSGISVHCRKSSEATFLSVEKENMDICHPHTNEVETNVAMEICTEDVMGIVSPPSQDLTSKNEVGADEHPEKQDVINESSNKTEYPLTRLDESEVESPEIAKPQHASHLQKEIEIINQHTRTFEPSKALDSVPAEQGPLALEPSKAVDSVPADKDSLALEPSEAIDSVPAEKDSLALEPSEAIDSVPAEKDPLAVEPAKAIDSDLAEKNSLALDPSEAIDTVLDKKDSLALEPFKAIDPVLTEKDSGKTLKPSESVNFHPAVLETNSLEPLEAGGPVLPGQDSVPVRPLKTIEILTEGRESEPFLKECDSNDSPGKVSEVAPSSEVLKDCTFMITKQDIKQEVVLGGDACIEGTNQISKDMLEDPSLSKCSFAQDTDQITEAKECEKEHCSSEIAEGTLPDKTVSLISDDDGPESTEQFTKGMSGMQLLRGPGMASDSCMAIYAENVATMEHLDGSCVIDSKTSSNKPESEIKNTLQDTICQDNIPTSSTNMTVNVISKSSEALKNHTDTSKSIVNKSIRVEEEKSTDSLITATQESCHITLPNCSVNQDINKKTAQKLLTSLTRQQQLSEVDDLYSSGQYEILASSLTECFQYCAQQTDCENPEIDNLPDRPTQMAMLLDSLWQLQRYSDCFYWTEACLHEAFNRYLASSDSENVSQDQDDRQMWATTVERLLAGLNGCFKVSGIKILDKQPKKCLTRLVQNLTSILCQQLEQNDCSVEMAIECTTPWVILHRVILFEEQQLPPRKDCIPSYMSVLFTAHEYMGKKALCWLNEGVLLHLILDVVVPQLRSTELSNVRDELSREVEQAILCLYGHPKKTIDRSKKKLQDHRVNQQLDLTWDRSLLLLKFFEPDELPCFDSNQTTKISPDEEQLFLRILNLIPIDCSPKRFTDKMKAYLEGSVETFPVIHCPIPRDAQNLHYLLADYYLKTFKWDAAIRFYMLDVCINPHRFDSWAGMALARSTQMGQDINSCDTLNKERQLCRKRKAQKCFELAVDLDPENTVMLIEYGNFAYTMHSFCSRLLKTETDGLSMEMFTKIEEEKDKMLSITEKCFKAAEKLDQEERWLQQFMLGKVAEKRGEGPLIFLKHYRQAARLLFESNAEYPLSLNYDPPQHYAFEAHEVHYRLHASILKNLEQMEGKILSEEIESLYKETLEEAATGPFMAVRAPFQLSLNTKRISSDPLEYMGKKMKLDDPVAIIGGSEDYKIIKADVKNNPSGDGNSDLNALQSETGIEKVNVDLQLTYPSKLPSSAISSNLKLKQSDASNSMQAVITDSEVFSTNKETLDSVDQKKCPTASHQSTMVASEIVLTGRNVPPLISLEEIDKCGTVTDINLVTTPEKLREGEVEPNKTSSDKTNCSSSGSTSPEGSSGESENSKIGCKEPKENVVTQGSCTTDKPTTAPTVHKELVLPLCSRSSDHADLINLCLYGIEECLVRYPRHYKSLYRLCHYYFHSKRERNLKKCHQLLLSDYRVLRTNKNTNINGLFKSGSVNTMFNDVWRMPIDEIDRAGSFASHMSRCVHLLMELLRAQRDHGMLLKLSVFLKRDPEKKDKKYLRDNERADLSKQALVLCLAAMRENGNMLRATDHILDLFRTVKEGMKEMPHKEGVFKTLLSDAYKKFKGLTQVEHSLYEDAVNFCQSELTLRKTTAESKLKQAQERAQLQAQALQLQVQMQAQVQAQAQAQVQAQAIQMGVNTMPSTLPFNPLQTRFPTGVNASLGNALVSSMFLPQMPVYRGRGRPPKVQQQAQRLHNAMMNMAQMIGLANPPNSMPIVSDSSKPKLMKQQKQRRPQQPTTSGTSTVVSSIIKDRPALSITTLPSSSSTTTSSSISGSSARADNQYPQQTLPIVRSNPSGVDILPSGQSVWQTRPRHSLPRPMNTPLPGNTDPRSNLNSSTVRREGPRPKLGNSSTFHSFQPQTAKSFGSPSQSSDPVTLLSRLPGLQVQQNPQPGLGLYSEPQSKTLTPQERASVTAQQQLERMKKFQMTNSQSSKPAVSVSKVSTTSSAVDNNVIDRSETQKLKDPNFDIIVLD